MQRERSRKLMERASKIIPGGVNSPVRAFTGVGGSPVFFASGEGAILTDVDGNTYIDYVGSWGPMILGHGNREVVEAVDTALPGSHATPRAARNEQPHATPETAHAMRQGQETRPPSDSVRETVKVLIASNSTLFSRKLAHVLSQEKYEVILVSEAEEVASHLEHKDIDLCFVRDSLPKGLDICEQFARRAAADHVIPIIVYSPQSRMRERALQRGAAGFLKVPCQPQDVLALVDRLCHHKPGRP